MTGTTTTGGTPAAETFAYDANNRLNTYNGNALTYDNSDNITKMADGSTLAYDDASQITTKTVGGVPTTYGYNTRGDRTSAGSITYAYDQAKRLTNYNGGVGTYAYDGDGLRTSKTVSGSTKQFVYNIAEGLEQVLTDGTNNYVYGPGGIPIEQINGSTVTYLHQDQLGSTRTLTDQSRNVVATYSYDPYGKATKTGSASTPLQYAGQYTDAESNLVWMRARYYDSNAGSFITVDPLRAATRAPYNYAGNEPTNLIDPSGLANSSSPWDVGVDWLTGTGPKTQNFTDGDQFAETLKQSDHMQDLRNKIAKGEIDCKGSFDYRLGGLDGPYKFAKDYSTLLTFGQTGNLAQTYLGSYTLSYDAHDGIIDVRIDNHSTIASGTHPPVIGYTKAWNTFIGNPMNELFSRGPMSDKQQTFVVHLNY